jgi:uncharacterized protein
MHDVEGRTSELYYAPETNILYDYKHNPIPAPPGYPQEYNYDLNELRIAIGKKCNFSCAYCSQHADRSLAKPEATRPAREFVTAVKRFLDGRSVRSVQFWGGEPLLYFKEIKELHRLFKESDIKVGDYFFLTNGSLLYGERLDWILENNIMVGMSHDGPGQSLRGTDVLDDPRVMAAVKKLIDDQARRDKGRFFLSPVFSGKNNSHLDYITYMTNRLGTDKFQMGESVMLRIMDENGWKCRLTEEELAGISRRLYLGLIPHKLEHYPMEYITAHRFLSELGTKPTIGSKCFASHRLTFVLDRNGHFLVCQNFSDGEADESGEPFGLGLIDDLEPGAPVPLPKTERLINRQNGKCSNCLLRNICKGNCPYTPEKYEDYNCKAAWYRNLPVFGLALYMLTGKVLEEVRAAD